MKKRGIGILCALLSGMILTSCNAEGLQTSINTQLEITSGEITTAVDETTCQEESSDGCEEFDPNEVINPELEAYRSAMDLIEAEQYNEAYDILLTIKGYRDVDEYLKRFSYKYDYKIVKYPSHAYVYYNEYDKCGVNVHEVQYGYGYSYEYIRKYDENYNLLEYTVNYGDTVEHTRYEYDDENRCIFAEDNSGYGYTIAYGENGSKTVEYKNGSKSIYEHDELGNCVRYTEINCDGNVIWDSKTEYDTNGNILEVKTVYEYGHNMTKYEYDENGYLIKETHNMTDPDYSYYYYYAYDSMGNNIKVGCYTLDGTLDYYYEYAYDENRNLLSRAYGNKNGEKIFLSTYEYDELGNCIKETERNLYECDADKDKVMEYDEYGNTLKITVSKPDGELIYITEFIGYKLYYNPYEITSTIIEIGK